MFLNLPLYQRSFSYKAVLLSMFFWVCIPAYGQVNHYVVIDSISVVGNTKLKPIMIERELLFKLNSIYNYDELDYMAKWTENLLMNTNHYVECQVIWTEVSYAHVVIKITLKEKIFKTLLPTLQRADRNTRQWAIQKFDRSRINYGLEFNQYKLFGNNQYLKLFLTEGYSRKYGCEYQLPAIDSAGKYGFEWSGMFRSDREIWYQTYQDGLNFIDLSENRPFKSLEANMAFLMNKRNFFYERWELNFRQIILTKKFDESQLNKEFLLGPDKQSEFYIRHVYSYDKRDNIFYPLEGNFIKNDLSLGNITSDTTSIELLRETFEVAAYRPLKYKFYISALFKFYISSQPLPYIPYQNFKSFGYEDYVRGYESYVVDGHAFILSKLNLKYAIIDQRKFYLPISLRKQQVTLPIGIYANVYCDWGKVFNTQYEGAANINQNKLINSNLLGYGAGLDFLVFNNKMLRFEYSLNRMGDWTYNLNFNKSF